MTDRPSGGPPKAEKSAGAFLAGYGTYAMPTRTLSDDIPGEPSALEAERDGATPRPSSFNHLLDRLVRLTAAVVAGLIVVWIAYALLVG